MSMIGILLRVTADQLEAFRKDSSLLEKYLDPDEATDGINELNLDKTWDAINFLLTGHGIVTIDKAEPPLSRVIFSGQFIDENQDMGYGPAQYLSPDQVKDVNRELLKISSDDLRKKYDAEKLNENEIYPQAWSDDEGELNYLTENFEELKSFYSDADKGGQAIITYIV